MSRSKFQDKNCCQSLISEFPSNAKVFLQSNFGYLARQEKSPGIWSTVKIGLQKYLRPTDFVLIFKPQGASDQDL